MADRLVSFEMCMLKVIQFSGGSDMTLVNVVNTNTDVALVDDLIRPAVTGELQVPSSSLVKSNKATAATLTIKAADVSDGWTCTVVKWAAGDVTISAGTGLTLRTAVSATIFSQYGMLQATRIGSDLLVG